MSKTVPLMIGLASALVLLCLVSGSASADGNNDSSTADPLLEGLNGPFDIDPAGDLDWYVFTVSEPALVRIETNGSSGDGVLYLYDANETLIQYDDDGGVGLWSKIQRQLDPGLYYTVVGRLGNSGTIFGYYITLEVETGTPLAQGLNGPWDCSPAGDSDLFKFNVTETAWVRLELNGSSGDPVMYLYDSDFNQIAYDDDGGVGLWSKIVRTLTPGSYFVMVRPLSSSGTVLNYYVTLEVDPGTPIVQGFNGPFDIDPVGDMDIFTFDVFEPSSVRVELDGPSGSTLMYLYDQNGTQLGYDYSSGNGSFSRLVRSLYPGWYYVTVQDRYGSYQIFNYTVELDMVSLLGADGNGLRENATVVGLGTNGPYDIDPAGDLDWYVITFPSAGIAVIQTEGVTGDTLMTLYSDTGLWLAQDISSGVDSFSLIQANVTDTTYYILVQGRSSSYTIYNYTLDIQVLPLPAPDGNDAPADAVPVGTGVFEGFDLVGTDVDWYTFTADTPGTLTAETNGAYGGTIVTLFEANGVTTVASGSYTGNNSFQEVSALVDVGTYLIRVQLYTYGVTAVLDYNLTITFEEWTSIDGNDFRSEAQLLVQGLNGPYSINPAEDLDWFWFEQVEAGVAQVMILGGNSQGSISLINETGVLLAGGIYGTQSVSRSLDPGVYYIRMQSYYGYYTLDSYYLNLSKPDSTAPPLVVAGPADQSSVDTSATVISGTTEPGAKLWVNGEQVVVKSDGSWSTVVMLAIGSNTFHIVAQDPVMNEVETNLTIVGVDPYASMTSQLSQAQQDLAAAQSALEDAQAAEAATSQDLADANAQITDQQQQVAQANAQADSARIDADAQRGFAMGAMGLAVAGVAAGIALAFLVGRRRPPTEPPTNGGAAPQAPPPSAPIVVEQQAPPPAAPPASPTEAPPTTPPATPAEAPPATPSAPPQEPPSSGSSGASRQEPGASPLPTPTVPDQPRQTVD